MFQPNGKSTTHDFDVLDDNASATFVSTRIEQLCLTTQILALAELLPGIQID